MSWKKNWRKRQNSAYQQSVSRSRFFSKIAKFAFFGVIGGIFLTALLFFWYARDLPQPDKIVRKEGFSTKIYDRNQKLLYDIYANQRRTPVELTEIPQYLREATLATEDKDFYKHSGFDTKGWMRAMFNIFVKRRLEGGSTLTQQLVKNVLLSSERTVVRKLKEFILAVQIERRYSKDEILQMYLNEAPYGGTSWGVEAASEVYFGKKVSELNLVESAILAGLPQSPSVYSPFSSNPKAYIGRTQQVLRRMREDGYITRDQENSAKEQLDSVQFTEGASFQAPHFVMYVKNILEEKYGERMVEQGGLQVTTTLDLDLQDKAQAAVTDEIAKLEKVHITNGAALVMDPKTGEILSMVGSKNYSDPNYDGKVNVVTSLRQPGSSIKPVTYVTAFKKGYTPATLLMDTPTTFPGGVGQPDYKPLNYDGKFHGPVQVRYALANSLNVPAVKMLAMVGVKDMLQTAHDMGFTTLAPTQENLSRLGLSVTLGGGEVRLLDMVTAYSAFANTGFKVEPVAILKVTDKDGKTLEEFKPASQKRVLTEEQAFLISSILSDNDARALTFGAVSYLSLPGVAVKTGTTNDKRDNWTVGWSPNLIAGVWVGNNDNTAMKEVASGVSGASPIWRKIIAAGMSGRPKENFNIPSNVVQGSVDTISGYQSHDSYPSRMEYFIKGTEPQGEDPIHANLKVCKGKEGLASLVDVARGNYDQKEFFVFKENDPSSGNPNKWQEGIDQWLAGQSDPRYHPPTGNCGDNQNQMEIRITQPADQSKVGSSFKVSVDPVSNNDIAFVEIYINGDKKATLTSEPYEKNFNLGDGVYTIRAKAQDKNGNIGEKEIKIGVNVAWNFTPPTPTSAPTPTTAPTATPTP